MVGPFLKFIDSDRLDFRRLPGPVFDPPRRETGSFGGWVRAHFPEQRLVIEPKTVKESKW